MRQRGCGFADGGLECWNAQVTPDAWKPVDAGSLSLSPPHMTVPNHWSGAQGPLGSNVLEKLLRKWI